MKKYIAIISIVIILLTVFFSGCNEENNSKEKNPFIGTWEFEEIPNETYTFREDKTGIHNSYEMTYYFAWDYNSSELCISPNDNPTDMRCGIYEFSNNYDTFTWKVREIEIRFKKIN